MMRFGVSAWRLADGRIVATEWRDNARRFADAGYETLWMADHVGHLDPFPALVAAADAAPGLRVGTYVLNNEFWNPLLLARVVATTDLMTGGRLVVGLGAGHNEAEFVQAGLRYPPPGERVGRLAATVPALRRLLAGETVDDEALGLVGAATGLPPVATPLLVGGNGDRVLSAAGRFADEVGLVGFTAGRTAVHTDLSHWGWDGLADRIAHVRAAADAAGRSVRFDLLVQRARVTDDPHGAVADFADAGPLDTILDSPFLLVGTADAIVDDLARAAEMGVAGVTVFGPDADELAPVVARVRS
jgi:probable F420-dependent oxidoreductase